MTAMSEPTALPFGSWPSPISAADVARGAVELAFPGFAQVSGDPEVWWIEGRPDEGGRMVLTRQAADGSIHDVVGREWNVRSRIIEYGALPWTRMDTDQGPGTVYCSWDDQRLYFLADGAEQAQPVTAPEDGQEHRYGDLTPGPTGQVLAVRERHDRGVVSRDLVQLAVDGSAAVRVLNNEHHFYANPRPSPDGRQVAYIAWDHPHMPWDSTVLAVVANEGSSPARERVLAGGEGGESLLQPEWADSGSLYVVSDRSGWWNLYRVALESPELQPLCPSQEEFGGPLWELGFTSYALLADGRLAVTHGRAESSLSVLDPTTGILVSAGIDLGFSGRLAGLGNALVGVAGSSTTPESVVKVSIDGVGVDLPAPALSIVRPSITDLPDPAFLPKAQPRTFDSANGRQVHAFVYSPTNPEAVGRPEERPPYLVFVHGGPTAHVSPGLSMTKAYLTSRGIGVIDVNYGGSTGYGRAYRERLREQWGIVDVEDCVAAALGLAEAGDADGARLGIRGGSAGGWTTLASLVRSDAFAAGAAYCPVTDLLPFAENTHDFESRYLDGLIGPLPETRERYVERSPLNHLDRLRSAVLLLQGDDDKVVPPEQPQSVHDSLAGTGVPHAYLVFPGEQHGFRKAESMIAALEAELSFFGQVFGFTPPGVPQLALEY